MSSIFFIFLIFFSRYLAVTNKHRWKISNYLLFAPSLFHLAFFLFGLIVGLIDARVDRDIFIIFSLGHDDEELSTVRTFWQNWNDNITFAHTPTQHPTSRALQFSLFLDHTLKKVIALLYFFYYKKFRRNILNFCLFVWFPLLLFFPILECGGKACTKFAPPSPAKLGLFFPPIQSCWW